MMNLSVWVLLMLFESYTTLLFCFLDILNEKEFVEDAAKEYDESSINCASELGLRVSISLVIRNDKNL